MTGTGPLLPTDFKVGVTASDAVAAASLAKAGGWGLTPPFLAGPSVSLGTHEPVCP